MAVQINPTKGNLMAAKKSLDLAKVGFDLLDRKRNILIRETMAMIDSANEIQKQIDEQISVISQVEAEFSKLR